MKTRYCEITYEYDGEEYTIVETQLKGEEEQFPQQVLNRIESITYSGGVITDVMQYSK